MNSSLNNISHAAETSLSVAYNQSTAGVTLFTQVSYSIIATVAFGGNLLVILIFVQDKKLLKKSYNMLILSLAISDLLTAIFLVTNPAFVLGDVFPYPTNHMLGELFCRLIWSRVFLFQMVVFSVYICLALSIERWYAVVHPIKYQNNFNKTRTRFSIFFAWLWSLILCGTNIFEVSYLSTDPPKRRCTWNLFWGGNTMRGILGMVQVIFKMVLPSLVMLALLVHMVYKTNKYTVTSKESRAKMRGKMTRVVGVACMVLVICFAPNQINYALAMAGKVKLDTQLHHTLALLVFVSSCLNPFLYGLGNKNYRRGYRNLLASMCFICAHSHNTIKSRALPFETRTIRKKPAQIRLVVFLKTDKRK